MKTTIGERLKEVMQVKNLTQSDICKIAKIPKSAFSMYVNDERKPRQDRISDLASALNVNEAWLMGYDVPMKRINSLDKVDFNIQEKFLIESEIRELGKIYKELDVTEREMLLRYAEFLKNN